MEERPNPGRRGPDPVEREAVFRPVAITTDQPRLGPWLALGALVLVILIVKPWDAGLQSAAGGAPGPPGPASPTHDPTVETPAPVGSPVASPSLTGEAAAVADLCLVRSGWLVASVERWLDQTVRVGRAVEPAITASGPEDPAIPVTPVVSEGLLELGWCAPVAGEDAWPGDTRLEVWRIEGKDGRPEALSPAGWPGIASPFGALSPPPRPWAQQDGPPVWPDGRYVFHHEAADGADRWFALEVLSRQGSEAPSGEGPDG